MVGAVLLQSRHLAWDVGALLDVRVLSMTGVTTSSELVGAAAATAVITPLGVTTLWFANGPFLASLRAGLGGVVRGGSVRADGAEISAFRGVAVLTSVGAGVRW